MQDIKGDGVVVGNQTNNGPTQNIVGDHANVSNYNFDFDAFISVVFISVFCAVCLTAVIYWLRKNARVRKATSPRSLDPREELKDFSPLALSILHRAKVSGRPIQIIQNVVGIELVLDGVRCNASSDEIQDAVDFLTSRGYVKEHRDRVEYDPARPVYFPTPRGRDLIENSGLKSELPRRCFNPRIHYEIRLLTKSFCRPFPLSGGRFWKPSERQPLRFKISKTSLHLIFTSFLCLYYNAV